MPGSTWFPEFRDEGVGTPYPFADGATLTSDDGAIALDRDAFLDAALYPIGGGARLGIAAILVENRLVTLRFGDPADGNRCAAAFDPTAPPPLLRPVDAHGRPAGLVVCDPVRLAAAQAWPLGLYTFRAGRAELAASCTVPVPAAGLRGLVVGDRILAGDVWLVGDAGVVVRRDLDAGPGVVRIDVVGDPLSLRRECVATGRFVTPAFVRTIAGVAPDAYGDWKLLVGAHLAADTILRIVPVPPATLRIETVGADAN